MICRWIIVQSSSNTLISFNQKSLFGQVLCLADVEMGIKLMTCKTINVQLTILIVTISHNIYYQVFSM